MWRTAVRARALDDDGCKQCAPAIRSRIDIALACEFAAVFPDDVDPKSQKRLELGHNRPHTVDILIESLRIVIEFDGSHTHKGDDHEQRDRQKTKRLRDAGYRVVRIREEPLPLLDLKFDVSIERTRRPDVKAITDKVLRHVTELGWVSQEVTRDYLASAEPKATVLAAEIYDSLPPSERFVPYSARKVRNRT
ncbi:hypothetical protein ASPU41_07915 [Arthrobacter sp. U41]|nr:hypothetical protein ASPU41_07915 [Arthrobacter sp. U41]